MDPNPNSQDPNIPFLISSNLNRLLYYDVVCFFMCYGKIFPWHDIAAWYHFNRYLILTGNDQLVLLPISEHLIILQNHAYRYYDVDQL